LTDNFSFPPHLFSTATLPWESVETKISQILPQIADFLNATVLA